MSEASPFYQLRSVLKDLPDDETVTVGMLRHIVEDCIQDIYKFYTTKEKHWRKDDETAT